MGVGHVNNMNEQDLDKLVEELDKQIIASN
jgi:hypothetical protein